MDAPAMFTRKQVPEDVGLRNTGAEESAAGGQEQLHREKEHKPVLKKVKDKVKKIKHTLADHSQGHSDNGGDEHARADYGGGSSGDEEEEGDAALGREAAMEKGGYMEDVEDKPVASEPDPEEHGAPMYESERTPAVQDLVAKRDPAKSPAAREAHGADAAGVRFGDFGSGAAVHDTAAREAHGPDADALGVRFGDLGAGAVHDPARRDDSPKVRLGDLGGPVVEDPAAPRSTQPAAQDKGEDIGTTPVVRDFESMTLSDDPSHVGAAKTGARAEEWKDETADKNMAAVPAEYGNKLSSTVYDKVAGGTDAGAGKQNDEHAESMPVSDAGAGGEEFKDAPADVDTTTDRSSSGPGYTDKIKSTAAGTAEYGKQLASAAYEKVAAVAPSLRPQEGAGMPDEARSNEAIMPPVSDAATTEKKDAMLTNLSSTDTASSGPGYTDNIKSAAAGTTEYGKQLASTVYEKVAGVGTAVVGKVQQATQSAGTATPGVGAQKDTSASTVTPGAGGPRKGQDKGVGVTGYIAEKLQPGDEDHALSEAISGAVQRRKEEVGGTVGQRMPAPEQMIAKAREAATSLTGGNRVSETVQPDAATGAEVKENVGNKAPMLRGEEIGERKLNTNTM